MVSASIKYITQSWLSFLTLPTIRSRSNHLPLAIVWMVTEELRGDIKEYTQTIWILPGFNIFQFVIPSLSHYCWVVFTPIINGQINFYLMVMSVFWLVENMSRYSLIGFLIDQQGASLRRIFLILLIRRKFRSSRFWPYDCFLNSWNEWPPVQSEVSRQRNLIYVFITWLFLVSRSFYFKGKFIIKQIVLISCISNV